MLRMDLNRDLHARCLGSVVSLRGTNMDLYHSLRAIGRDKIVNRGGALVSRVSSLLSVILNFSYQVYPLTINASCAVSCILLPPQ